MTSRCICISPRCCRGFFRRRQNRADHHPGDVCVGVSVASAGGIAFGQIGDRLGRRRMMLLSVAIMTAAMFGTACCRPSTQIGAAAGWLLFLLRCVMGFSVGGEYTGVVAYLLEGAPENRRGLITSLRLRRQRDRRPAGGWRLFPDRAWVGAANLDNWGWRIPFLVGAALAASVWIARSTMQESPDFQRQQASGTVPRNPLRYALAASSRRDRCAALPSRPWDRSLIMWGSPMCPRSSPRSAPWRESQALRLSAIAALAVILITPVTGALCRPVRPQAGSDISSGCSAHAAGDAVLSDGAEAHI